MPRSVLKSLVMQSTHFNLIESGRTWRLGVLAMLAVVLAAAPSIAQPVPLPPPPAGVQTFVDQGLEFSVVNTAGVTPPPPGGRPFSVNVPSFAISRTELSVAQWYELHNALVETPLPAGATYNAWLGNQLTGAGGFGIAVGGQSSIGRPIYTMEADAFALSLKTANWLQAVMYCNWLHNDRAVSIDAIMFGAYDLRGVTVGDAASFRDIHRSPDARYWLPSDSEWSIASFWDPNHPSSQGAGGWWSHLNRRDRVGIGGLPAPFGSGETSYSVGGLFVPIGAYAQSQSAFGLLDTSGGAREWLDTSAAIDGVPLFDSYRLVAGTEAYSVDNLFDGLERLGAFDYSAGSGGGIRIATSIPAPGAATGLGIGCFVGACRSRRFS